MRLELEGFGPYRDATVVDFAGADLFALTGPTGSGKSAVIDAICFALYGSIPRYDDRRLVAPAISQGMAEALVRLEFAIGDDTYTAVRVVKRTKTGATTKEARLERSGSVLAGNEKELTAEVERLLGLTYEHFTKCVVLPQGEFARFLHDKPDRRQELLVQLLDLGVYGRMAALAHQRGRDAERDAASIAERLGALAGATVEARTEAEARVDALARLRAELEADLPVVAALAADAAAARAEADALRAQACALAAVDVPSDLAEHAVAVSDALAAVDAAEQRCAAASAATVAAEAAAAALGPRRDLELVVRSWDERATQAALVTKGEAAAAAADAARVAAIAAEAPLLEARAEAIVALDRARVEHAAHALREHLVVGEPCPVCEQPVATAPSGAPPADLDAARAAEARAVERAAAATKEREEAGREHDRVLARLDAVRAALADLDARLVGSLPRDEATALLEQLDAADAALASARADERTAQSARTAAAGAQQQVQAAEAAARRRFHEVHAAVAGFGAPPAGGTDLADDWAALAAWASAEAPAREASAAAAAARAEALEADRAQRTAALEARVAAEGVSPGRDLRDAVVAAHTSAVHEVERVAAALADVDRLRTEHGEAEATRDVAKALHAHLGSRGFERWLLDEAVTQLVAGATETLLGLSGGQYSLTHDERGFAVVDHRNADQVRSARTLSGGETFLASLALALALADHLALLAGRGGARLESLFLDEGFGTLDPETLDVVAAAIDELGARGRMVGIISHVPELAERVPVRFAVTKHGNASTIERQDQ